MCSLGFVRFLGSQIRAVPPIDPWTLSTVALILVVAGLSACFTTGSKSDKSRSTESYSARVIGDGVNGRMAS